MTLLNVCVFESVPFESSSRLKLAGERPPPAVNAKSCASFGTASLTAMIWPRLVLVNVHVTVSPALTFTFVTGLPSSQVADDWSQPTGTVSESEYPEPGTTLLNVCVFASVAFESSSSENVEGDRPPPAVNAKSCASSGTESSTITILPRLRLAKVHVTVSPALTSMFDAGLPSLQVALVWSQPLGTVSSTE